MEWTLSHFARARDLYPVTILGLLVTRTNTTRQINLCSPRRQKGDAPRLVAGRGRQPATTPSCARAALLPARPRVSGRRPEGGKRGADGVVERTSGDGGDGTKPGWGERSKARGRVGARSLRAPGQARGDDGVAVLWLAAEARFEIKGSPSRRASTCMGIDRRRVDRAAGKAPVSGRRPPGEGRIRS